MNKIFVWIPKTGGTSVFNALQAKGMRIFLNDEYNKWDGTGDVSFGHTNLLMLINKGIISAEYWKNCHPLTIVRNPYSRFVSLYHDYLRTQRISDHTSIEDFAFVVKHTYRKPGLYNAIGFSQASSQVSWMVPGLQVLRFETLASESKKKLGITIEHLNSGNTGKWQEYYTPDLYKVVADLYYDDFLLLNYEIYAE